MNKKWYELDIKDIPSNVHYQVLCPVVRTIPDGGNWSSVPIMKELSVGWNPSENTITVLDMTQIATFDPFKQLNNFNDLFKLEADAQEKQLLLDASVIQDKSKSADLITVSVTQFAKRFIKKVYITNPLISCIPDPARHAVLVTCRTANIISNGDIGNLIPIAGIDSITKVRISPRDILRGTNGSR